MGRHRPLCGLLLIGLASLFLSACDGPPPATADLSAEATAGAGAAASFTMVALNAEWLFDGVGEGRFDTAPQSAAEAEEHLTEVADYLASLDADYISLAEIEDLAVLEELNALLPEAYHPVFVQGLDTYTGQDVGALSRPVVADAGRSDERAAYPVEGSTLYAVRGDKGVSKHYWAEIEILGMPVTVIGVHFLAIPNDRKRASQREAQATVIRRLVREILEGEPRREVILLGDFNDYDREIVDASGSRPISCTFDLLTDLDDEQEGDEMVNLACFVPEEERYTCWYDRDGDGDDDGGDEYSQLDTVLVSRGLLPYVDEVWVDHSYAAGTVSDHWPVIVRFTPPSD
ncbi:MAG: endonuclease [Candidatus Bipolaricaulota bacterium]|nr:MAG: endonuclease [Candidatus Bipolaricaulota bacterium]